MPDYSSELLVMTPILRRLSSAFGLANGGANSNSQEGDAAGGGEVTIAISGDVKDFEPLSETDVAGGTGATVILTLTGADWVSDIATTALATFASGWSGDISFDWADAVENDWTVTRTSDTVVTVEIDAAVAYDIGAMDLETITIDYTAIDAVTEGSSNPPGNTVEFTIMGAPE